LIQAPNNALVTRIKRRSIISRDPRPLPSLP